MSLHVRRRLDFDRLKQEIDNMIDYELNVCNYSPVGEFIGEVCDMLNERILDDIVASTRVKVSLKEKDELYKIFENPDDLTTKAVLDVLEPTINSDKLKEKNNQLEEKFIENYQFGATLVKHKANNNSNIYCFYIDCDDWTFEKLLIRENLKINYVAHKIKNEFVVGYGLDYLGYGRNLKEVYILA